MSPAVQPREWGDVRELREEKAELGEEAEQLAGHRLDVVLSADDDEASAGSRGP
jgi:hypothetical protein